MRPPMGCTLQGNKITEGQLQGRPGTDGSASFSWQKKRHAHARSQHPRHDSWRILQEELLLPLSRSRHLPLRKPLPRGPDASAAGLPPAAHAMYMNWQMTSARTSRRSFYRTSLPLQATPRSWTDGRSGPRKRDQMTSASSWPICWAVLLWLSPTRMFMQCCPCCWRCLLGRAPANVLSALWDVWRPGGGHEWGRRGWTALHCSICTSNTRWSQSLDMQPPSPEGVGCRRASQDCPGIGPPVVWILPNQWDGVLSKHTL